MLRRTHLRRDTQAGKCWVSFQSTTLHEQQLILIPQKRSQIAGVSLHVNIGSSSDPDLTGRTKGTQFKGRDPKPATTGELVQWDKATAAQHPRLELDTYLRNQWSSGANRLRQSLSYRTMSQPWTEWNSSKVSPLAFSEQKEQSSNGQAPQVTGVSKSNMFIICPTLPAPAYFSEPPLPSEVRRRFCASQKTVPSLILATSKPHQSHLSQLQLSHHNSNGLSHLITRFELYPDYTSK